MRKHIPIKRRRQKTGYTCGPACLQMIFHYYDVHHPEHHIAHIAGTTEAHGTSLAGLKKAAQHFGFDIIHKDKATFKDIQYWLKRGVAPIVDWFSDDEGHYSVVVGLDDKYIYFKNPERGGKKKLDRKTFYRVWFDFTGEYIADPKKMYLRRLIVVQPKQK